jgi:UDP-galactose transporter B1
MMLIGVGVALFAQKQSGKVTNKLADPNAPVGYLLCFINLAFDGYTNAAQDEINQVHPKNHPLHMMTWMNFWTGSYYLIYLFAVTDQGQVLLNFCMQHPDAAQDILLFCICGAVGQLFIFFTIKTFGSLINTLICTTRKFFNILISVVINVNPLLPVQWVAVSMVFCGLITSSLTKKKHHQHQKKD